MAIVVTPRCRLTHQQKKNICQFSVDNPAMAQAQLVKVARIPMGLCENLLCDRIPVQFVMT